MTSSSKNSYAQWTNIQDQCLTVDDIDRLLKHSRDDAWVVSACVDRLLDDVQVQRHLLQLGIQRTEEALGRIREASLINSQAENIIDSAGIPGPSTPSIRTDTSVDSLSAYFRNAPADARLCWMRSVLLERLDRLNTYEELLETTPTYTGEDVDDTSDEWEDDPWGEDEPSPATNRPSTSTTLRLPVSLSTFLLEDIDSTACVLATLQWFQALCRLRLRHACVLWPHRFSILECIPAHVHPSEFREILPSLDPTSNMERRPVEHAWRSAQDWSEAALVRSALQNCADTVGLEVLPSQESTVGLLSDPLTADALSEWYRHRVDYITSSTGMIDVALASVQHAASQGVTGLDELGEELSLFSRLVYDAPRPPDGTGDDWSLSWWRAMDSSTVIREYLKFSTDESIAQDISSLVMPYLYVMESRAERAGQPDPTLPTRLLYDYILSAPLNLLASIFETSKPNLPIAQRLISNDEDIAKLALACLYGSSSLDSWSTMSRIFECMPAWDEARNSDNDEDVADTTLASLGDFVVPTTSRPHCTPSNLFVFFEPLPISSLSRALDILDMHLEAGEILSRWNVPAPLQWFLQSHESASQQRGWAIRMSRRAGGLSDPLDTKDDWEWLLEDMLKLTNDAGSGVRGAFGLLSRNEVIHIFLGGLLSSGKLDIAKTLFKEMQSKLSLEPEVVEDICLACSREFYDNASSGNYNFGNMKLAYDCLGLPPQSTRVISEKEFIEATSRLSSFNITTRPGIPISPIEIRLTKDRLSLVAQVLTSNADAYKHTDVILELVHKLGFRNDLVAEVRTLAMLTDTALQAEDFVRAYETSERMVDSVHRLIESAPSGTEDTRVKEATEVCWVACYQLGRQPEFDDTGKKLALLGRAIDLCPRDKLHDIILSWRRLEKADMEARQERLDSRRKDPTTYSANLKPPAASLNPAASLRAKLQHFHMPTPPLLSTPDAAALATRTFRNVAANFPFSVGSRGRSQTSHQEDAISSRSGSRKPEGDDVSVQASRVISKGIGWLIGADDE